MALTNFSLPFGALAQPVQTTWGATISPLHSSVHQLASNTNNLLYAPADHQQQDDGAAPPPESDYYKNNPYAPPQLQQQQPQQQQQQQSYQYNNNNRYKSSNTYLPPIPPPGVARNTQYQYQAQQLQQQYSHISTQQQPQQQQQHQQQQPRQQQITNNNNKNNYKSASSTAAAAAATTRTYGEGSYNRFTTSSQQQQQQQHNPPQPQQLPQQKQYYNSYNARASAAATASSSSSSSSSTAFNSQQQPLHSLSQTKSQPNFSSTNIESPIYGAAAVASAAVGSGVGGGSSDTSANEAGEPAAVAAGGVGDAESGVAGIEDDGSYPVRPPGFTRVQAGAGTRTQVHAVLDYDVEEGEDDEYYDEDDHGEQVDKDGSKKSSMPTVTPIQGPIFLKNGTVPVVPLFSYPTINNGSFIQIPIWWTALSVALGLDVRGDIIKGVPCIKRYHQLFCPTAGNSYPIDKIERFIDDNKALMRRMYGDFEMNMDSGGPRQQTKKRRRRFIDEPDIFIPPGAYAAVMPDDDELHPHAEEAGESYFGKLRNKRQSSSGAGGGVGGGANQNRNTNKGGNFANVGQSGSSTGRLDACESKVEIVTPYWASNSAGKIRAIVNTQHFEQAIHQEICSKSQTPRCERDCGCEQKYKWHRLLAYDPDNDCKGIFMDWFLFPSCCVCRCNP